MCHHKFNALLLSKKSFHCQNRYKNKISSVGTCIPSVLIAIQNKQFSIHHTSLHVPNKLNIEWTKSTWHCPCTVLWCNPMTMYQHEQLHFLMQPLPAGSRQGENCPHGNNWQVYLLVWFYKLLRHSYTFSYLGLVAF